MLVIRTYDTCRYCYGSRHILTLVGECAQWNLTKILPQQEVGSDKISDRKFRDALTTTFQIMVSKLKHRYKPACPGADTKT